MKLRYWLAASALCGAAAYAWNKARAACIPRNFRLELPGGRQPEPSDSDEGSISFIGTATTLIRFGGLTILTDPNFLHRGDHIHIGYGMHTTRLTNPAIDFEDLPAIDCVLLSHLHEDHFDRLVQERLAKNTPILTTASAARSLARIGFTRACGLRTWDSVRVRKGSASVRITATPGRHGPALVSAAMPDVMGSMLEFRNERSGAAYRLYITGDTLVYRDLLEIPQRYPRIDLALLHLGGTRVMGALVTMDAAQGLRALRIISPDVAIPIHYDDYPVFKSPLQDFIRAVEEAGLEHIVQYLDRGDTYTFTARGAREAETIAE